MTWQEDARKRYEQEKADREEVSRQQLIAAARQQVGLHVNPQEMPKYNQQMYRLVDLFCLWCARHEDDEEAYAQLTLRSDGSGWVKDHNGTARVEWDYPEHGIDRLTGLQ